MVDRRTDRPTDIVPYRVAQHATKRKEEKLKSEVDRIGKRLSIFFPVYWKTIPLAIGLPPIGPSPPMTASAITRVSALTKTGFSRVLRDSTGCCRPVGNSMPLLDFFFTF